MTLTDFRSRIQSLGTELTPELITQTQSLCAEISESLHPDTTVERDLRYGTNPRHRLDIFTSPQSQGLPVLVFVHGGGFVGGDKRSPSLPFHDNIGDFAVKAGFLGVTMTYRLAPDHPWPAGSEDVALAVSWLKQNVETFGGDSTNIFVMGQSAGAVHVAGYVAHQHLHPKQGVGIAGALLVSCIYDNATAEPNDLNRAYFGEDKTVYPETSTTKGILTTEVPLLMTVSEFDVHDFRSQAASLVARFGTERDDYPRMLYLAGHNHLSPVHAIGSRHDTLGPEIAHFIREKSV